MFCIVAFVLFKSVGVLVYCAGRTPHENNKVPQIKGSILSFLSVA